MTTFCVFCTKVIAESRAWRGSHFCSPECHKEYRRLRRSWRATKACRLCGHRLSKRQQKSALPSEHKALDFALPSAADLDAMETEKHLAEMTA